MQRTTLLCATDLHPSGTLAADLAVALARAGGFHLELIHVADMAVDADTSRLEEDVRPAAEALRTRIRERVERLARRL
ncbi:MAG: universal stress protein, partial [Polyangiales bacterium]